MSNAELIKPYISEQIMFYVNIDGVDYPSNNLPPSSNNKATIERRERRKKSKLSKSDIISAPWFTLAPLQPTTEAVPLTWDYKKECYPCVEPTKQEGKTPMRYNDNYASAHATVAAPVSDTAVQRDYLLSRLCNADYPKNKELANLFNLYTDNTPKTYKDLIDAIKNDKFTIDKKVQKRLEVAEELDDADDFHFGCPFTGIIWAGPQADREGYDAASKEKTKQYNTAKDVIMSGVYADGLKALQDFEAWLPVGKSN